MGDLYHIVADGLQAHLRCERWNCCQFSLHCHLTCLLYTSRLSMDCFWCEVVSGELVLKEAEAARWLTKEELDSVPWLPADQTILEKIQKAIL